MRSVYSAATASKCEESGSPFETLPLASSIQKIPKFFF
jgi:hypothetical protein